MLSRNDVIDLVENYTGHSVRILDWSSFQFTMYDSFVVRVDLDDYGSGTSWGFGVSIGPDTWLINIFGQRLGMRQRPEEILAALEAIDRWCRIRLGPKCIAAWTATNPPKS